MEYGLTKRQLEIFKFIKLYIRKHGYSPSYAEIAVANNCKARSHIHKVIRQLEQRKWVISIPGTARSIKVLK